MKACAICALAFAVCFSVLPAVMWKFDERRPLASDTTPAPECRDWTFQESRADLSGLEIIKIKKICAE